MAQYKRSGTAAFLLTWATEIHKNIIRLFYVLVNDCQCDSHVYICVEHTIHTYVALYIIHEELQYDVLLRGTRCSLFVPGATYYVRVWPA